LDDDDVCQGNAHADAVRPQDHVIHPDGRDCAGPVLAVGRGNQNDLVSILGIEESISDGAPSPQRYSGGFLLSLENLGQLEPQAARNIDEIGVAERVHRNLE
jgi:hypothetical protein